MKSAWSEAEARKLGDDPVALRVYSSRLLGLAPELVLHGGGNTSVKASAVNLFGESEALLYVKGSGWDLATIERKGFAPVRMKPLLQLAEMKSISDSTLVSAQRAAMTDQAAPDPSVEAVLHAIIPYAYVDHTHADAVVALSNSPDGEARIRKVFGENVVVVPYVMPGFPLARAVHERTRGLDWSRYRGMILLSHGIFTWGNTARDSYEAMTHLVSLAEEHLAETGALRSVRRAAAKPEDLARLSAIRRAVSRAADRPMLARLSSSAEACGFAELPQLKDCAGRGPLTPDHIIRTKRVPVILGDDPDADVAAFSEEYRAYFTRHSSQSHRMLDVAPRWGVWPGHGVVAFGKSPADAGIIGDIAEHTIAAVQWAESLGGWRALPEKDLFEVEYWELEQAKLGKGSARPFDGRVAIVTGSGSGIGAAVVAELSAQGAAVIAVDVKPQAPASTGNVVTITADVTDAEAGPAMVAEAVRRFGGLDILVSNAGIFPRSARIDSLPPADWDRTLDVNLTSHQRLLTAAIPFLKNGIDPAVVLIGSKNAPAPGPGQSAYSVSKAGLTQLGRVAALELAADGIRVNVLHPNAVFDTGVWTPEVLASRAAAYGMTVEEYKRSNLLGTEVTSQKVAAMVAALAGPLFSCTTGAQIPIDGGNDRVI